MEKEITTQVHEAQRVPYRINPRRNMARHILIKVKKKNQKNPKRTNIKSSKKKATHNTQGDTHKAKSCSFYKNPAGQKGVAGYTYSD